MAYTSWVASTAYAVGDIVCATSLRVTGLVFRCTVAGTSDSSEPAWPTDIGSTATDNTVTWQAISSVYEDLSVLAPSAIIELFELRLDTTLHGSNDVYRWHNGVNANVTGNITWNGNSYVRLPIEADGFDFTNTGSLPRPTLTISNLSNVVTTLLLLVNAVTPGNDLGGAQVKRIRTLKKHLDGQPNADPNAKFPDEIWYIDRKSSETRDAVSFELASKFDLAGIMLPQRQIIANICQWQYRSSECSYNGSRYFDINDNPVKTLAQDVCGKRLSSCSLRFDGYTRVGTVTNGSNQLVLTESLPLYEDDWAGTSVVGHGIPASTTISSYNQSTKTVTLSANATSSSSISTTGTIASTRDRIVVASATGLTNGMKITGSSIPAGTSIFSISGTTVYLSQLATPIYALETTKVCTIRSSIYRPPANYLWIDNKSVAGLSVGMYVTGAYLPSDYTVKIVKIYTSGYIEISYNIEKSATGTHTYSFYSLDTYTSQTYQFTGDKTYIFGSTNAVLPFGSFPAVGLS
jgi:lambda family phage minor tail protein L